MRTRTQLHFKGVVSSRGEAGAYLKSLGDAVLVERGRPRLLLLSCPCGCGEHFPINLDPRAGPAWRLYRNSKTGVTLFPSVWRESGCRSHYVIWRDRILLFGQDDEEWDDSSDDGAMLTPEAVQEQLPISGLMYFSEIAEALDAVPWDVLQVCRRLVRSGVAREGRGKHRGHFGRK
jgi:hypothetical protein